MLRHLELTILQELFRNKQQNMEETILAYPILFPSFGETNKVVTFLLVQAKLYFSLVSLVQAQGAAVFGQSQLILRRTKTQILYC